MAHDVAASAGARVALLTDPAWDGRPGVQRWRAELVAAVAEVGAVAVLVPARPGPPAAAAGTATGPRLRPGERRDGERWRDLLPPAAVRLGGRARRRLRTTLAGTPAGAGRAPAAAGGRAARTATRPFQPAPATPPADLAAAAAADVVVAESPDVLPQAVGWVPRQRLWCLFLPPERAAWGEKPVWARPLSVAAGQVAGFVTDSADARTVLERALPTVRATVVVLPPLAAAHGAPLGELTWRAATGEEPAGPPDGAEQLDVWAALLDKQPQVLRPALSYPVRRLAATPPEQCPLEVLPWSAEVDLTPGREDYPEEVREVPAGAGPGWEGERARAGVRDLLRHSGRRPDPSGPPPRRVAVVGHDLKFMTELAERLARRPDLSLELDEWRGPSRRNTGRTEAVVRAADTLVAEWARPNAAWLSQVKRPDQRLIVRLHRFELTSDYVEAIQIDRVDAVVHIAPVMGTRIRDELGWPEDKLVYLPNFVDVDWLDRPKHPDARFTLAMIGAATRIKRLDLALDLLARVRAEDPRFHLLVRTGMPYDTRYGWRKQGERRFYQLCAERIEKDPLLRGAVRFDPFARDVAAWLQGAGHILSLSDHEGSHSALSEGMASGAVPVVRGWHGVTAMYDPEWVRRDGSDAAEFVLQSADPTVWAQRSQRARAQLRRDLAPDDVVAAWADLLHGDVRTAAERFGGRATVGGPGR